MAPIIEWAKDVLHHCYLSRFICPPFPPPFNLIKSCRDHISDKPAAQRSGGFLLASNGEAEPFQENKNNNRCRNPCKPPSPLQGKKKLLWVWRVSQSSLTDKAAAVGMAENLDAKFHSSLSPFQRSPSPTAHLTNTFSEQCRLFLIAIPHFASTGKCTLQNGVSRNF